MPTGQWVFLFVLPSQYDHPKEQIPQLTGITTGKNCSSRVSLNLLRIVSSSPNQVIREMTLKGKLRKFNP